MKDGIKIKKLFSQYYNRHADELDGITKKTGYDTLLDGIGESLKEFEGGQQLYDIFTTVEEQTTYSLMEHAFLYGYEAGQREKKVKLVK